MADTQEFLDHRTKILRSMPEGMFEKLYEAIKTGEPFDDSWESYDDAIASIWQAILQHFQQEQETEPGEPSDVNDPYCSVCGTCGFIGCCGITEFLKHHVKGKTNCLNEDLVLEEIELYCDDDGEAQYSQSEVDRLIREAELQAKANVYYEVADIGHSPEVYKELMARRDSCLAMMKLSKQEEGGKEI